MKQLNKAAQAFCYCINKKALTRVHTPHFNSILADCGNRGNVLNLENCCLAVTCLQFPIQGSFSTTVRHLSIC